MPVPLTDDGYIGNGDMLEIKHDGTFVLKKYNRTKVILVNLSEFS